MTIAFDAHFEFDRIVWLCSLKEEECGVTRRILEDLETLCGKHSIRLHVYEVSDRNSFDEALSKEIEIGGSPIIHLDGHGSVDDGFCLDRSNQSIPFAELNDSLRLMNIESQNNLLVVSASCFGLYALSDGSIYKPTPYFAYLAPGAEVLNVELEKGTVAFYSELLQSRRLESACRHLPSFELFQCQHLLFSVLIRLKNNFRGRRAQPRLEQVISKAKQKGVIKDDEQIGSFRRKTRRRMKTLFDDAMVQQIASSFLIGRAAGFSADDLEAELRIYLNAKRS